MTTSPYTTLLDEPRAGDGMIHERSMTAFEFLRGNRRAVAQLQRSGGRWLIWINVDASGSRGQGCWLVVMEDHTTVIAEIRSNLVMDEHRALDDKQVEDLAAMGWLPATPDTPNFHVVARGTDEIDALCELVEATILTVLGVSPRRRCRVGFQAALLEKNSPNVAADGDLG